MLQKTREAVGSLLDLERAARGRTRKGRKRPRQAKDEGTERAAGLGANGRIEQDRLEKNQRVLSAVLEGQQERRALPHPMVEECSAEGLLDVLNARLQLILEKHHECRE
jgi:hypothetical protein